ncbi:DUF2298 domain-containing protein [Desulfobacterales bacterium]|nr:DUF2298 domain-containing protein [Desulfobacterales bacterium]
MSERHNHHERTIRAKVAVKMIILKLANLFLLLTGAYLAGMSLLPATDSVVGIADAILYFVWGLILLTLMFLLSKLAHLPWFSALIPIALLSIKAIWRGQYRIQRTQNYDKGELLAASALSLTAMLPIMIMGYYMATGSYPNVLFAVDSPYYLHQVHALMTTSGYPPPSFELYGYASKYHYGVQALTAVISLVSGIKPHTVMFGIVVPLLQFLTYFLAYLLVTQVVKRGYGRYIVFGVILIGAKHHILDYLDLDIIGDIVKAQRYHFRYAHPPSLMGMVMTLAMLFCVLNYQKRRLRIVTTLLVGLMPMVKIPYAFFAGAGYATFLFWKYMRCRDRALMAHLFAAGALCILSYYLLSARYYGLQDVSNIEVFGFLAMTQPWQLVTLSVYTVLTLVLWPFVGRLRTTDQIRSLGMFVLGIFVLFLLLKFRGSNARQVFDPAIVPVILFLVSVGLASCDGGLQHRWYRKGYICALLVVMIPGLVSLVGHTYILLTKPALGHEYVSNAKIGEVLSKIPTQGTLIVTNDLRYPANNYKRKNRQFQFAGIFGHQNLATNFKYVRVSKTEWMALRKIKNQIDQLFCGDRWKSEEVEALKQTYPITHLVIHKNYPHPEDIPLEKVYENEDYILYVF